MPTESLHVVRARQIADAIDAPDREGTLYEQFVAEFKAWEAEDQTRTMAGFDRAIGRAKGYTADIVRAVTAGLVEAPFSEAAGKPNRDLSGARKVLRESKPEELQSLVDDLPEPAVRKLADATAKAQQKPAYRAARDEHDRHEREMSERERFERTEAADKVGRSMDRLAADFTGNKLTSVLASIPEQIEEVADDLRDTIGRGAVSDNMLDEVEQALDALPGRIEDAIRKVRTEVTVARGMAELG